MASDIHVALGPLGILDYQKLHINAANRLLTSSTATSPTGPFRITVGAATAVAADPIPVPLTGRVSLAIRNLDPAVTIYFGEDASVTPDNTATGGWEIRPNSDINLDLDADNVFFLITPAATTAVFKIFEIAST